MNYIKYFSWNNSGSTELLPITSSSNLILCPEYFGLQDLVRSLTAIFQIASLITLLTYLRNDNNTNNVIAIVGIYF